MRKVFFWMADYSGCGWYRMTLPALALRDKGWDVRADVMMADEDLDSNVFIGQRVCQDGPTALVRGMKTSDMPLIYEVDDDLLDLHETNLAHKFYSQDNIQANVKANIIAADHVTVTNAHLAENLSKYNRSISILPNYIDASLLSVKPFRKETKKLMVGWAGSATHMIDADMASEALRSLSVPLKTIGWDLGGYLGMKSIHKPWRAQVTTYYKDLNFDIGICPLADTSFNRSKSPIKALEYAAMGIPVVASNVGPYADFVTEDFGILVNNDTKSWTDAIQTLIHDETLRHEMSRNAKKVASKHTIQAHIHKWEATYMEVINARRRRIPANLTRQAVS